MKTFCFGIFLIFSVWKSVSPLEEVDYDKFRLSGNSKPQAYILQLDPHLDQGNFTFTGFVTIVFENLQETNNITLQAKDLIIDTTRLDIKIPNGPGWNDLPVKHEYNGDFLIIKSEEIFPSGWYMLNVNFKGKLGKKNVGFYVTSYLTSENRTAWIAKTNFEPNYARYAFPCFDDYMEAKFWISLKRTKNQTVWSNTSPLFNEYTDEDDGKIWRMYGPSPQFHQNQLVLMVGEHPNPSCPIWTSPDAIESSLF